MRFWPVFLLVLGVSATAQALSPEAAAANQSLQGAAQDYDAVLEAGYSARRISDALTLAQQLFAAQLALEQQGGTPDFRVLDAQVREMRAVREKALETGDQLAALKRQLDAGDFAAAQALYDHAAGEFEKERYDETLALIDKGYQKISEIEAQRTTANVIYRATTETVGAFLRNNWQLIGGSSAALGAAGILMRNRIGIYRTRRRIQRLELERRILGDLIKQAQSLYFEKKTLPEETYVIRLKKFTELIRDINRQIPLLKEQIEKKRGAGAAQPKQPKQPAELEERIEREIKKARQRDSRQFSVPGERLRVEQARAVAPEDYQQNALKAQAHYFLRRLLPGTPTPSTPQRTHRGTIHRHLERIVLGKKTRRAARRRR